MPKWMHSSSQGIALGLHVPSQDSEHFPSLSLLKGEGFWRGCSKLPRAPPRLGDEVALAREGNTIKVHGVCRRLR